MTSAEVSPSPTGSDRPISLRMAAILAVAIHLDWHVARPAHGHLSFGWPFHWLLAVPVFGAAAWYMTRRWQEHFTVAGIATIAAAVIVGQGFEALIELVVFQEPLARSFGGERMVALGAFMAAGIATFVLSAWLARRARRTS